MKIITVPLSTEALYRLDFDQVQPGDVEEIEIDDAQYKNILESGLFDELNEHLNILIDDYEDESIKGTDKLKIGIEIISGTKNKVNDSQVFDELERLFKLALEKQTGVFFFF